MNRRRNGSGTLYRRGRVWYAQIMVGGRTLRLSTGETDKRKATVRLDTLAKGYDLSDEERLAAVSAALKPRRETVPFDSSAWTLYMESPQRARTAGRLKGRRSAWLLLFRWAKGGAWTRTRKPIPAALPRCRTLEDLDEKAAARFVADLRGNFAPQTITQMISQLSMLWRELKITPNPWTEIPPERGGGTLRRSLTEEELRLVIRRARGELRKLLIVGAYTGLRISDAATLRWESIDRQRKILSLVPRKTQHTSGVTVTIPIHPVLRNALGRHRTAGFVLPHIASLCEHARSAKVQRHFRRCGLATDGVRDGYFKRYPIVGFHSFRVGFVSRLANAGMPLAQIQGMVGHVSPRMTLHYYRADAEAARPVLERLPTLT